MFMSGSEQLGQGDVGVGVLKIQIKSYIISRPKPEMICNIL